MGQSLTDAAPHAAEAVRLATLDPGGVRSVAEVAIALAGGDPLILSTVERALGIAAREQRDTEAALVHLRRAVDIAEAAGLPVTAAEARCMLVSALALRGDLAAALATADLAAPHLHGHARAVLELQRANVLNVGGQIQAALAGYRRALPGLRRDHDDVNVAKLLNNRGLLHVACGDDAAAEADFIRAVRLHDQTGNARAAAEVRVNLGFAAARRGDVLTALRLYAAADSYFETTGQVDAEGMRDRCEVLLDARLLDEARAAAGSAIALLDAQGRGAPAAEARLLLAETRLLEGDATGAASDARAAHARFAEQGRAGWAALSRHLELRAVAAGAPAPDDVLARACATADELEATGWLVPALDARIIAARLAVTAGAPDVAAWQLARARAARRRGPIGVRAGAWYAEALLRLARGDRRGTMAALTAGMRLVDASRSAFGATDLRAHTAGHAAELARLGLRLSLDAGHTERAFVWMERWRAGGLRPRARRDSGDASELEQLRAAARAVDLAAREGTDTRPAIGRQVALEDAVRRRSRMAAGGDSVGGAVPTLRRLRLALGEATLLELVELDGKLHSMVVGRGPARWHTLADVDRVTAEVDAMRFARRRQALLPQSTSQREAVASAAAHAATALDELLVGTVRDRLGDGPVVVVPTGALHALAWPALPTLAGRPLTIAPSAALWYRAASAPRPVTAAGAVVVVGAPDVPHAAAEVAAVRRFHAGARRLAGAAARCGPVLRALEGAQLAHIAAHGRFRADNPMLSHLELADGPLTVYDIERLRNPPRMLVLSACDSGLSAVQPGDELLGLAGSLLSLGVETIVAPVGPIPHGVARELMVALHAGLAAGHGAAVALADAQHTLRARGGAMELVTDVVCLGFGG